MPISCDFSSRMLSPAEAIDCLASGGLLLFPTETFYALGCLIHFPKALAAIRKLKGRNKGKPLPLAAASMAQLARYCDLAALPSQLTAFWPGPLTLVLPLKHKDDLDPCLVNSEGRVAVRISAHPAPTMLAEGCNELLTVSSANIQGRAPQVSPQALDPELLTRLEQLTLEWGILPNNPDHLPHGNLPSTIVLPEGKRLVILRQGALSAQTLSDHGFSLCFPEPCSHVGQGANRNVETNGGSVVSMNDAG